MYYYVINPAAGGGAINGIQDKLRSRLKELGIEGELAKTTGPGDATKMVKAAIERGYNTIVAVGGDGTVNEVINGITKDNVAVGIIPIGRGNQVAHNLGIHSWKDAVDTLAGRRLTAYGLISAGNEFFLSSVNLGFEADLDREDEAAVAEGTDTSTLRSRIGKLRQGYRKAAEFEPLNATIEVDGRYKVSAPIFNLRVGNLKFDNPLADNRLSVTITSRPDTVQRASYLWKLLKREDASIHSTTHFTADKVTITTDPPTSLLIDGKQGATETPITIRLTDRRIRFITSKQSVSFKGPAE